jgi:hypothetical protein
MYTKSLKNSSSILLLSLVYGKIHNFAFSLLVKGKKCLCLFLV